MDATAGAGAATHLHMVRRDETNGTGRSTYRRPVPRSLPEDLPTLTRYCAEAAHAACPHERGSGGTLGLRGFKHFVTLCTCSCHERCPLQGKNEVAREAWERRCTCPGAPAAIRRRGELSAELAERRVRHASEWALVKPDLRLGPDATAATIRTDIAASLARHGLSWDDERITYRADVLAASLTQGPKLVVAGRILKAQFGPIATLLRQARQHGEEPPDR